MAPKKPLSDKPPPPPPESQEEEDEESSSSSSSSEAEEEGGSEEEEKEEGSDNDDDDEEEEEEESEVEEEKNKPKTPQIQQQSQVNKNPIAQKQTTSPPQSPSGSEEEEEEEEEKEEEKEEGVEEEEEEEEEESENHQQSPPASGFIFKPITPIKPTSKEDSKPTSKRPSEPQKDDEKDARSGKRAKVNADELKKNKPSVSSPAASGGGAGRVWSDEDMIGLLRCMIEYKNAKGVDPSADMAGFQEFVKGKLQVEYSKTQIYEKVRRLKSKFFNYAEKSEKGVDNPALSKPLEAEAFHLSKKIWGSGPGDGVIANGVHENVKAKKSGKAVSSIDNVKEDKKEDKSKKQVVKEVAKELMKNDDKGDFASKYPFLSQSIVDHAGSSMSFLKENMSLIGDAKAKELNGRWKKLREVEAEALLEKLDLMKEHTKLVLEDMKKKQ